MIRLEKRARQLLAVTIVATMAVLAFGVGGCSKTATEEPEKVLRWSYTSDIEQLDPHFVNRLPDFNIIMNMFNGLVRYSPGTIEVVPDLAERYEVSPDGLTYTFYLHKGVQFHKGYGELTAKDVKYSLERVKDPATGSPYAQLLSVVDNVEVVNDYTVKIHMTGPDPDFLQGVLAWRPGYIVCEKAINELGAAWAQSPIGTGPYMFESHTPGEKVELVVNPDYFRGEPLIDRTVMQVIPDETVAMLALSAGDLDYVIIRTTEAFVMAHDLANVETTETSSFGIMKVQVNANKKPLDDIRIRQALSHALNRDEIVTVALQGRATAEGVWSILPPGVWGHTEEGVPRYPYDEERAKALLAEAGYPGGQGLRSFENIIRAAWATDAEICQGYWEKIGVKTNITVLDGAALTSRANNHEYDLYHLSMGRTTPNQYMFDFACADNPQVCNTNVNDLYLAQRNEPDPAKRRAILEQMQRQMATDLFQIPIYRLFNTTAYRTGVTGDAENLWFIAVFYWEFMDIETP
ncbi:MAG: ABC transporter substrate-binding protein [Bacillota bacterium]|nr:MAG: ABC transporter substrate-binding protein [Bacillota bacterium]